MQLNKKLQDILLTEDKIGYIVSQLPNMESQNAFLNYLKTSGTKGNKDLEYMFVLYFLNATSVNEFGELIRDFMENLDRKVDMIEDKINELDPKLESLGFAFDLKLKGTINEGIKKIIQYVSALSNYVIELSEKQAITEEEIFAKLMAHIDKALKPILDSVDAKIEAKIAILEPVMDSNVLAIMAKQTPPSAATALNSIYKRVKALGITWEPKSIIRDVVVNGSTMLGVLLVYHFITKFI